MRDRRSRLVRSAAVALTAGSLMVWAPATVASPAACSDPCEISALPVAYGPPVQVIASGTTVEWSTADTSHPTADNGSPQCFRVPVGRNVAPVPVRFDVDAAGTVTAVTAPGTGGEQTATCGVVLDLGPAGVALPYHCNLHPWMNGVLVIER